MSQKQVIIDKKILTGCDPRRCLDPVFIVMCVRVLRRRHHRALSLWLW